VDENIEIIIPNFTIFLSSTAGTNDHELPQHQKKPERDALLCVSA